MELDAPNKRWLRDMLALRPQTPSTSKDDLRIEVDTVAAGETHCVVALRGAIFTGTQPLTVSFDDDVDIRTMSYEGGVWMTDSIQELWQMRYMLRLLRTMTNPRLLVGGLGLGVFSRLAARYAGAHVTTVERDERIIHMVAPYTNGTVIHADIFDYARRVEPNRFNIAFLDTWQSTGEMAWTQEVVPLRRLLAPKVDLIHCWQEGEMAGQVRLNAFTQSTLVDTEKYGIKSPLLGPQYQVIQKAAVREGFMQPDGCFIPDYLPGGLLDEGFKQMVDRFLKSPGSSSWEAEFGDLWDEYVTPQ